jgi:hypothetical protein
MLPQITHKLLYSVSSPGFRLFRLNNSQPRPSPLANSPHINK